MTQSDVRPAATVEEVLALLKQGKWVDRVEAVNLVFAHIDTLTRKVAEAEGLTREVSGQDYYSAKMDRCVVPVEWFTRRDALLARQPLSRPQETDAVLAERDACAKIAAGYIQGGHPVCTSIAAAIRSRPSPGPATETERNNGNG